MRVRAAIAANRDAPQRTINKLDAIRYLLHSSIRLHFMEEDRFVIQLAVAGSPENPAPKSWSGTPG